MLDLSIIIVSWNVRDMLAACLDSLQRAQLSFDGADEGLPSAEIIVVDSASSDGSVDMLRESYPTVQLLPQAQNLGFSRCNNIGLAWARGRFILLLNPDTEVQPGAIGALLDYLHENPDAGIIGPHTLNSDGSHQSTRRRFPNLLTGIFESTWLAGFAPARVERDYRLLDTEDSGVLDVDWAQGSALLLRREVYCAIGGLDEGYTMYYEELDYCRRAKQAGWRVVYHGGAFITHHGGQSSEQAVSLTQLHFHTSKLRYFRKYHGFAAYALLRGLLLAQFGWQLALESLKGALGHKRELRTRRARHYWHVLRSGLKAEP